ncbi:SKP1-like protein 21 [Forsythia ovata]|uniref:SKP1-like protein 21 n=1 Tax=Forsythia ovata TaxID=205694 RepID=A0ABD1Q2R8_9LAMI
MGKEFSFSFLNPIFTHRPAAYSISQVNFRTMTEADSKMVKPETPKTFVWLQTSDGSIQEVEQEVAMFCPFLWHEIHLGMGSSENCPISLPSNVNAPVFSLILDYCRFHQVSGRSKKEKKSFDEKFLHMDAKSLCELTGAADSLQLSPLVALTSRAIARAMNGRTAEEIREIFHLPDDLTEEEKLEPIRNTMDNPRIRLWNRLQAKKREELKEIERLKNVEVEEPVDDRSVDDLLSFINGGDGDSKGTRTSKNKKKNRRRKDRQTSSPFNCTSTASSSSSFSNATVINKESGEIDSAENHPMVHGNFLSDLGNTAKLLDFEDGRVAPEVEFDDCGVDPALKEKIDREVVDFAQRLHSDWPGRMQEILSLGPERRPLTSCISGNGPLRRFTNNITEGKPTFKAYLEWWIKEY